MPRNRSRGSRVNQTGRTVGDARHIRIYHWMLNSPAWKSLSLKARCLLLEVWQRHNGQNNGEIAYSVREGAKAMAVGKDTVSALFRELEDRGFLNVGTRGSFHWKGGMATTWKLTMEPCGDDRATKEFMSWRLDPEKQKPVPGSRTSGPCHKDRDRQISPQKPPHGPSHKDHEGENHLPTVPGSRTLIVYQGEPGLMRVGQTAQESMDTLDLTLPDFLNRRLRKQAMN